MRSNLLTCIAFAASLSACSSAAEIPDTPDLRPLNRDYDFPTAVLDPASADSALAEMPTLGRLAAGIRSSGYATRGVDEAGGSSSKKDEDRVLNIQGSIRVTLRCPGELDDPVFDTAENGSISLTIGVAESRIRRGVGGVAENCVLRGEELGVPIRVAIDGPIAFDLGRDLSIRDRWAGRLLMVIRGSITIGDLELSDLSARFTAEKFEYLFRLTDGTFIIAEITTDNIITIRDRDFTWLCANSSCATM
jgi:hypothetical protein